MVTGNIIHEIQTVNEMKELRDRSSSYNVPLLDEKMDHVIYDSFLYGYEKKLTNYNIKNSSQECLLYGKSALFSVEVKSNVVYTCPLCEHVFCNKSTLYKHKQKHNFCQYCKEKFKSSKDLTKHKTSCNFLICMTSHPRVDLFDIASSQKFRNIYKSAFRRFEYSNKHNKSHPQIKQEETDYVTQCSTVNSKQEMESKHLDKMKNNHFHESSNKVVVKTELIDEYEESIPEATNITSFLKLEPLDIVEVKTEFPQYLIGVGNDISICSAISSDEICQFDGSVDINSSNANLNYSSENCNNSPFGNDDSLQSENKLSNEDELIGKGVNPQDTGNVKDAHHFNIVKEDLPNNSVISSTLHCHNHYEVQEDQNFSSESDEDSRESRFSRFKSEIEEMKAKIISNYFLPFDVDVREKEEPIENYLPKNEFLDSSEKVNTSKFQLIDFYEKVEKKSDVDNLEESNGSNIDIFPRGITSTIKVFSSMEKNKSWPIKQRRTFVRLKNLNIEERLSLTKKKKIQERLHFHDMEKIYIESAVKYVRFTKNPNLNLFC